ncbi:MAG: MBL fold metallo-hydrolase, partial [Acidobacteria bacterium]|nr:MBL fold metallo-hydrolase [Acidobacteriota bacterium]
MSTRRVIFFAVLCSLLLAVGGRAEVKIEYIAHACFVITSPGGTRVVVDPYNTNRWLGYSFPDDLEADAVLITHPHYDHDAGYYFPPEVPVFRNPGRYQVGDVRIRGVGGRHAEPYGKEFGQSNTLWVVEAGGLRIAHLGDTGPLSPASMRGLGPVDVLMIPVDSLDHILKKNEIEEMRAALRPRITVPMHYRITGLTELPRSLGPIEPWLEGRRNVRRLGGNQMLLARESLPETDQIMVFNPSPAVRRWNAALFQA